MKHQHHFLNHAEQQEQQIFNAAFASMHTQGTLLPLSRLLFRAAQLWPEKTALIFLDKIITYRQLFERACAVSEELRAKGVKPRDRVLIFIENSIDFYVAYFAVAQCGAIVAALNIFLHEKELAHIIADAIPTLIATTSVHAPIFEKLAPQIPIISLYDAEASYKNIDTEFLFELDSTEVCVLLYTSGTTGFPKGVMLSAQNIMTNIAQAMSRFNVQPNERFFSVLPLFHSFAQNTCIWSAFFVGTTVIVVPKIERRYILEGLRHTPTIFLGVPALYGLLCLLKTAPLDSVRYFVCGGDALPNKIRSFFALVYGRNICNGYGLTETSPFISVNFDDVLGPTNSVGRPFVGIECELKNEEGVTVAADHKGELWVKGDNVMLGYYNAPDATAKILHDGWLATGDIVTRDVEGNIIICGREKDMIAHKGIKIYPAEIENIILTHAAVMRAAVVGQPDEQSGEVPVAFVQLRQGEEEKHIAEQLRKLCIENLASYKVPRQFIILKEMPVTATGKVDKKVLRTMLKT